MTSGLVSLAKACHGMIGARTRPSGRAPVVNAVAISSIVQPPRPVSLTGVRFRADKGAKLRDLEPDIGTAEIAGHIRFSEEIARRMAISAVAECGEILSALDLALGIGRGGLNRRARQSVSASSRGVPSPARFRHFYIQQPRRVAARIAQPLGVVKVFALDKADRVDLAHVGQLVGAHQQVVGTVLLD